jgi:DNA polymerase/3'-5' exonuclease PolX
MPSGCFERHDALLLECHPDIDLDKLLPWRAWKSQKTSVPASSASAQSTSALAPLPDLSRNGWAGRNKDKWQCQQQQVRQAPCTNLFLADQIEKLGEVHKAMGGKNSQNDWRHFTFSKQAKALRALDFEVTSASQLKDHRGFGKKSIDKIDELLKVECEASRRPHRSAASTASLRAAMLPFRAHVRHASSCARVPSPPPPPPPPRAPRPCASCLLLLRARQTGELQRLTRAEGSARHQSIQALCKVHGVGTVTAEEWYKRGITTVEEAVAAGVLNAQQEVGARHWVDLQERIPREEVSEIVQTVRRALRRVLRASGVPEERLDTAAEATGAGSYRRGKPSSGDVDVLITRRDGGPDSTLIGAVLAQLQEMVC